MGDDANFLVFAAIGFTLMLAGGGYRPLAKRLPERQLLVIGVVLLWGGISFAIYPVGLALLGRRFRGGDIARANTAFSMLYILGGMIGRPLVGAAMDAIGEPGLGWTLAVFYFAATVAALLALRRRG